MKTVLNVFGIIGASILSIFLVISLVTTPAVSAVSSFFKTENVQEIFSSIDYSKMITAEMDLDEEGEIQAQLIEDIMDSKMMEEVLELTVDNMFNVMEGKSTKNSLTAAEIQTVAEKHMDEITSILKKHFVGDEEIPEEYIDEMASEMIDELAVSFAEMLPTTEDMGLDRETVSVISSLRNGTYFWTAFAIAAVLTVLVMLCQVMRFKGFMWISVDYYVAAVGTLIIATFIKSLDFARIIDYDLFSGSIISAIVSMVSGQMFKGALILLALGILFTVIFVAGRKSIKKKNTDMNHPVMM